MLSTSSHIANELEIAPDTFIILLHDKCKTANYSEAEMSSHSNSSNSVLDRLFLAKYLFNPFTTDFSHLLSA